MSILLKRYKKTCSVDILFWGFVTLFVSFKDLTTFLLLKIPSHLNRSRLQFIYEHLTLRFVIKSLQKLVEGRLIVLGKKRREIWSVFCSSPERRQITNLKKIAAQKDNPIGQDLTFPANTMSKAIQLRSDKGWTAQLRKDNVSFNNQKIKRWPSPCDSFKGQSLSMYLLWVSDVYGEMCMEEMGKENG